jgi:hypothetical protein
MIPRIAELSTQIRKSALNTFNVIAKRTDAKIATHAQPSPKNVGIVAMIQMQSASTSLAFSSATFTAIWFWSSWQWLSFSFPPDHIYSINFLSISLLINLKFLRIFSSPFGIYGALPFSIFLIPLSLIFLHFIWICFFPFTGPSPRLSNLQKSKRELHSGHAPIISGRW